MAFKVKFKQLNIFVSVFCIGAAFFLLIYDLFFNPVVSNIANRTILTWDPNIDELNTRGIWLIVNGVLSLSAGIIYFIASLSLNKSRKIKQDNHYITTLFYSSVYLTVARVIEAIFMVSFTDLEKFLYGVGLFSIPMESIAYSLLIIFASEIFLSGSEETKINYSKMSYIFAIFGFILGVLGSVLAVFISDDLMFIVFALGYFALFAILIVVVLTTFRIIKLIGKVDERKESLRAMAIQLILTFILGFLILISVVYSLQFADTALKVKSIKNIIAILHATLYIIAFVKPGKKK